MNIPSSSLPPDTKQIYTRSSTKIPVIIRRCCMPSADSAEVIRKWGELKGIILYHQIDRWYVAWYSLLHERSALEDKRQWVICPIHFGDERHKVRVGPIKHIPASTYWLRHIFLRMSASAYWTVTTCRCTVALLKISSQTTGGYLNAAVPWLHELSKRKLNMAYSCCLWGLKMLPGSS